MLLLSVANKHLCCSHHPGANKLFLNLISNVHVLLLFDTVISMELRLHWSAQLFCSTELSPLPISQQWCLVMGIVLQSRKCHADVYSVLQICTYTRALDKKRKTKFWQPKLGIWPTINIHRNRIVSNYTIQRKVCFEGGLVWVWGFLFSASGLT